MFTKNLKSLFRSVVKASNAAVEFATAAKEIFVEVVAICRIASSAWSTFKA